VKASVKIPATSANLGPGFDCFGIALQIYNTITIEELVDPNADIEINVFSDKFDVSELHIPTDETNIVYKAVDLLFSYIGHTPQSMRINIYSDIPLAKGFGSSASVIVGGLLATNKLLGSPADINALISIATEIEGHPDNVAPAFLGGFVLSSLENDGSVITRKLNWPEDWKITMCIPDFELQTSISRSVLPETVSLSDAAYNARRTAMMIDAIINKDETLMKTAIQDKLHQPYRMKLVPGLEDIIKNLKNFDNVIGTALSGAGPGIIVISNNANTDEIKTTVQNTWDEFGVNVIMKTLKITNDGAQIL